MGEIIKFDFNNNKRVETDKKQNLSNTLDKWWEKDNQTPILFRKFFKFLTSEQPKKIRNLTPTPEALYQARQIVKDYTTKELMGWMENSNEKDWQAKPSFFNAMLEELKIRAYDKNQWLEE